MLPGPGTSSRPRTSTDSEGAAGEPARRAALRAGDADREHAAASLRRHLADGRLTEEEFTERLDAALSARTLGDVAHSLRELPDLPPAPPADPALEVPAGAAVEPAERTALTRHLVVYLLGSGVLVLVWLLGGAVRGDLGPFWPGWILLPWAVAPLLHAWSVSARAADRQRRAHAYHLRARRRA